MGPELFISGAAMKPDRTDDQISIFRHLINNLAIIYCSTNSLCGKQVALYYIDNNNCCCLR